MIFGEPGLEKANIAALIHYGSSEGRNPVVRIDCERLDNKAVELFGAGAKKGLLHFLRSDSTLILNNVGIVLLMFCDTIQQSKAFLIHLSTICIMLL